LHLLRILGLAVVVRLLTALAVALEGGSCRIAAGRQVEVAHAKRPGKGLGRRKISMARIADFVAIQDHGSTIPDPESGINDVHFPPFDAPAVSGALRSWRFGWSPTETSC
jgi:hypothetical protein